MSELQTEPVASKKAVGTTYVVLRGTDTTWTFVQNVEARSAHAAIRAIGKEGKYVAVPERSFQPVTVKVETKTQLAFS